MTFKQYLNIDQNAKTVKGQRFGYLSGILYLAPSNLSGKNVCPFASKGCRAMCLNTAGRGQFNNVQKSRIAKTKLFWKDQDAFANNLGKNICSLVKKANRMGLKPCVRLNGTSDLDWTKVIIQHPYIKFYDYTKDYNRMVCYLGEKAPDNYHLTFSLSESNMKQSMDILERGGNVAMVFDTKKGKALPKNHLGYEVVDGDESDLRFLDDREKGVIIGLRAKGKARKDTSGFVQSTKVVKP